MSTILHIISSPRGDASNSIKLGNAIVEQLKAKNPGASVQVKDLTQSPFPHLEEVHLNAFHTPITQHSAADKEAILHSNQAIEEIFQADILVIGAPMYNFGLSSTLKAWFDHIARAGITFKYTNHGPEGLILGKKVYLAICTGGIYSSEENERTDYLTPYLSFMLNFLGMDDVTVFRAEGFSIKQFQGTALEKAIDSIVI